MHASCFELSLAATLLPVPVALSDGALTEKTRTYTCRQEGDKYLVG